MINRFLYLILIGVFIHTGNITFAQNDPVYDPSIPSYGAPVEVRPAFDPSVPYGYPDNYGESSVAGSGYDGPTYSGPPYSPQGNTTGGVQSGRTSGGSTQGNTTGGGTKGNTTGAIDNSLFSGQNDQGGMGTGDVGANVDLWNPLGDKSIGDIFLAILDIIMVFAVPVILFFLVWAGFLYVTAQGNEEKLNKAHRALLYAIIGGLLVLGAQVLLYTITNTIELFDQ